MQTPTESIAHSKVRSCRILKNRHGESHYLDDLLVAEEPLEISLCFDPETNEQHKFMITMRTPGNDKELVTGLLITENVIHTAQDIENIIHKEDNQVLVIIAKGIEVKDIQAYRNNSSCGACGKEDIEKLGLSDLSEIRSDLKFDANNLSALNNLLTEQQTVFTQTGGIHGAMLLRNNGDPIITMEDIGRHNAVDKVIGWASKQGIDLQNCCLLVSSRIGFEIVQKASRQHIPIIFAVGAPSSLAVEVADKVNMCLIGFLKQDRFNVYTHSFRIKNL